MKPWTSKQAGNSSFPFMDKTAKIMFVFMLFISLRSRMYSTHLQHANADCFCILLFSTRVRECLEQSVLADLLGVVLQTISSIWIEYDWMDYHQTIGAQNRLVHRSTKLGSCADSGAALEACQQELAQCKEGIVKGLYGIYGLHFL